ncbi:MAG: NUDIX hydrolase [bacterium]|nr:NUDIX hydrolase [bacterium]
MDAAADPAYYDQVKRAAVEVLKLINPAQQPYGTELFDSLCRLTVTVAIEAVCLRRNTETGEVEALLTQRRHDDTAYPGEWHFPGSVKRPGELDEQVLARLAKDEFCTQILRKRFVENYDMPHADRGHFLHLVYLCEVAEEAKGTWYPVDLLPEKIVHFHRDRYIPMAVRAFSSP